MRVCKTPESHLKQPVLCSFSRHFLSQWTAVESRFSWGQLLLVVINLVSCQSPWFSPHYVSRLWAMPSFTSLSLFSYCFSRTALFICLIYLIVTCQNLWGSFNFGGRRPWNRRDGASGRQYKWLVEYQGNLEVVYFPQFLLCERYISCE